MSNIYLGYYPNLSYFGPKLKFDHSHTAITRHKSNYHEPERSNPDRFFTSTADGRLAVNDDSTILTVGFGRR